MRDIRYLIVHSPGPKWQAGRPIFEQAGVQEHIAHFRQLLDDGRLLMGGPFLDEHAGGMMVSVEGVGEDEVTAVAHADPAVRSGLLRVAVRPWLIGMKR